MRSIMNWMYMLNQGSSGKWNHQVPKHILNLRIKEPLKNTIPNTCGRTFRPSWIVNSFMVFPLRTTPHSLIISRTFMPALTGTHMETMILLLHFLSNRSQQVRLGKFITPSLIPLFPYSLIFTHVTHVPFKRWKECIFFLYAAVDVHDTLFTLVKCV